MRYLFSILLFVSFSFTGKAQTFCDTMFGDSFKFEYNSDKTINLFNNDTLDFYKGKEISDFVQLNLNCKDSSFYLSYAHSNILDINSGLSEDGDEIITSFTSSLTDNGEWKLNSDSKIISFKMINTENWYSFKIIQKGSQGDNPYIYSTSTGDYRYLIRLISVK